MGYSFGGFLIASDLTGRHAEMLGILKPGRYRASGPVSIREAVSSRFHAVAAGTYAETTLVLSQYWPYDCSFDHPDASPLDERLAALSAQAPVLCVVVDETSMTFALSYFEGGRRVRVRHVEPEAVRSDWGEPLPPEEPLNPASHDDSERIMRLTEWILGERLDALLADDAVMLTRYEG